MASAPGKQARRSILSRRTEQGVTELLRTNNLVLLSFLEALLVDAGIEPIILDVHASVMDGSALAVPRRLMVWGAEAERARRVLSEAGFDPDGVT
jgi:hypothetical protein